MIVGGDWDNNSTTLQVRMEMHEVVSSRLTLGSLKDCVPDYQSATAQLKKMQRSTARSLLGKWGRSIMRAEMAVLTTLF
jgi:cytochrome c551/c552